MGRAEEETLSDAERELLTWMRRNGRRGMTCTEAGELVYAAKPGKPARKRQCYARPGGRLLRSLERKGLAVGSPSTPRRSREWRAV